MVDTALFYQNLIPLQGFRQITQGEGFTRLPDDWHIAVSDVQNSTGAIEGGRYKEVNISGAMAIIALLNLAGEEELPFVFGGDGASILIPPHLLDQASSVLAETASKVLEAYGLVLRVGVVPMHQVTAAGEQVALAKVLVGEGYHQAVFRGGGMAYAEDLVKDPVAGKPYRLPEVTPAQQANYDGLECRWQDIPSPQGETVSLLVKVTTTELEAGMLHYGEVLDMINQTYGQETERHPISLAGLNLSFSKQRLQQESKLFAPGSLWAQKFYRLKLRVSNALGVLLMDLNPFLKSPWRRYRQRTVQGCDYQKFDGMLRMVVSGRTKQRKKLEAWLQQEQDKGRLVYGLHVSDRALMTCLIFQRHGRHVHFVDGADGGYALAAKSLKAQLKLG
ncbi:DUF3095 domain-containing protein [Magnetococcus sp. PR-3]|uniref:DUF3095 domain-containing protein n=1 Tax=Magnetococcus sp. PR-3 TaxID=3120355 RepID=UPI002FCE4164